MSDRALASVMTLLTIACADCSALVSFDGFGGAEGIDAAGQDAAPRDDPWPLDAGGAEDAVGRSDAAGPSDADTSLVDAPQADADAGATDAASPDAEAGPPSSCASLSPQPVFCEDFDQHPLPGVWTRSEIGGALALTNVTFVSPPSSLDVRFSNVLGAGQPLDTALRVQFPLPAPPATLAWEFHLRPLALDNTPNGAAVIASLDFADGANNRYSVQFTMFRVSSSAYLRLEEQSGFTDGGTSYAMHALPDPLAAGWNRVELVVTRSGPTTASVHVAYGAKTELNSPLQMTVNATVLQVTIGSSYESEPSSGWDMLFDNVILNF